MFIGTRRAIRNYVIYHDAKHSENIPKNSALSCQTILYYVVSDDDHRGQQGSAIFDPPPPKKIKIGFGIPKFF